jgi:hypothetical protein
MQALRAAARPVRGIRPLQPGLSTNAIRTLKTLTPYVPETPSTDPQLDGYPELPFVSKQRRPARAAWDDPQMRRNFGETVSIPIVLHVKSLNPSVFSSSTSTKRSFRCGAQTRL